VTSKDLMIAEVLAMMQVLDLMKVKQIQKMELSLNQLGIQLVLLYLLMLLIIKVAR